MWILYGIYMVTKIISLSLPAELLKIINEAAKAHYASRSDYIRESVVMRLKSEQKLNLAQDLPDEQARKDEELLRKHGMI